jgi:hypothetical protein
MKIAFNKKDWKCTPVSEKKRKHLTYQTKRLLNRNLTNYMNWLSTLIENFYGEKHPPVNDKFTTQGIEMNSENTEYLRSCLTPSDWLNLCPSDNDNVPVNSVWISFCLTSELENKEEN